MKRTIVWVAVWAFVFPAAGCNRTGKGLKQQGSAQGLVRTDPQELATARALEVARVNYEFRLNVLRKHFDDKGDVARRTWAERELKNLAEVGKISVPGLGRVIAPKPETLSSANKALLVEYVIAARKSYLEALADTLAHYGRTKNRDRLGLVRKMQDSFDPVSTYMYFLSAEVPGPGLRASKIEPQADEMFAEARRLHKEGTSVVNKFTTAGRMKRSRAIEMFRRLVWDYPRSDKIALAAYYAAELYRGCGEDLRALAWYGRAWQWDPEIDEPALFRMATLCDLRLNDRESALKYYRLSIQHEGSNSQNVQYATVRMKLLSND